MSEPFYGEIRMAGFSYAPRMWAMCDGQLLDISQNEALYSLLGTAFGGNGTTTFGLPDMRGRVPVHQGAAPGLTPRQRGQKGGAESVTLTSAEVSSHSHAVQAVSGTGNSNSPAGGVWAASTSGNVYSSAAPEAGVAMNGEAIQPASGGAGAHNNMQPWLCINYIICLMGIYPQRP